MNTKSTQQFAIDEYPSVTVLNPHYDAPSLSAGNLCTRMTHQFAVCQLLGLRRESIHAKFLHSEDVQKISQAT